VSDNRCQIDHQLKRNPAQRVVDLNNYKILKILTNISAAQEKFKNTDAQWRMPTVPERLQL